jgi:hypothetical protein
MGVAQIAEMQGLEPLRIDDVRMLPDAGIRNARVLALFTIGETPWSASQRALILAVAAGTVVSVIVEPAGANHRDIAAQFASLLLAAGPGQG